MTYAMLPHAELIRAISTLLPFVNTDEGRPTAQLLIEARDECVHLVATDLQSLARWTFVGCDIVSTNLHEAEPAPASMCVQYDQLKQWLSLLKRDFIKKPAGAKQRVGLHFDDKVARWVSMKPESPLEELTFAQGVAFPPYREVIVPTKDLSIGVDNQGLAAALLARAGEAFARNASSPKIPVRCEMRHAAGNYWGGQVHVSAQQVPELLVILMPING